MDFISRILLPPRTHDDSISYETILCSNGRYDHDS